MKVLAKIFIILSIICGFFTIYMPIVGFIALKKIRTGNVTVLNSIMTMIFCSFWGGLFMLFIRRK